MYNRLTYYVILLLLTAMAAVSLTSCEDDLFRPDGPIKEGTTQLSVQLSYKDFTPALESRSSGTAIKTIDRLWVVLYDKDNKLVRTQEITDFKVKNTQPNTRPDGGISSETQTGHAEFKLTVDNGYYHMYAVVNHDLSTVDDSKIANPDLLKRLDLTWQSGEGDTDAGKNSQMFGWFVAGDKSADHGETAPLVTIGNGVTSLHAWVRRAASKVTIAFNTVNLSENVRIYLKSVTIKDIPTHCYLHDENAPGDDHYTLSSELIDGETYYFGNAEPGDKGKEDHYKWKRIHSGDSIYGLRTDQSGQAIPRGMTVRDRLNYEHAEEAPALYFYENMQGEGTQGTESDKRQDVNGENKQVTYPDGIYDTNKAWKDAKPFGSYIEVKGYYENEGDKIPGHGDITYRFMLGKDVITNYDAERNYHYRLTLQFNGNANDIDFHIDYIEEGRPGLDAQDTTYVSYLYNQQARNVVRATPRPGYDLLSLESYILDNEWRPYSEIQDDDKGVDDPETTKLYNYEAWKEQKSFSDKFATSAGDVKFNRPDYKPTWTEYNGTVKSDHAANNCEFGFLSLRHTSRQIYEMSGSASVAFNNKMRKLYFYGDQDKDLKDDKSHSRGYRDYGSIPDNFTSETFGTDDDGKYSVTRTVNRDGTVDYVFTLPLYTRAKTIDSWAVYSGANPYYRHRRYARIIYIATYKKTDPTQSGPEQYQEVDYTHVLQSLRIDNPRGIYRSRQNKEPFYVMLCYNKLTAAEQLEQVYSLSEDEQIYEPIISRGPWTATIECDPHNLVKISANGQSATGQGHSITGRNNTPIQFTYTPQAIPPQGDAYGAIITVYYHNNSATHKVIVRQGYDAHTIGNGVGKWSAYNVFNKDSLTVSPLSVGSTFRRYTSLEYPIRESNNFRDGVGMHVDETPTAPLWIIGKKPTNWADIPHATGANSARANNFSSDGTHLGKFSLINSRAETENKSHSYRLAERSELPDIGIHINKDPSKWTADETSRVEDIGQAFGITYADGATKTLYNKKAFSFYDPDNKITESDMGVRGVVLYSVSKGDNVFFPFGALGHSRRRRGGLLMYGSVDYLLVGTDQNSRPMAYNLMTQSGGAYWIRSIDDDTHVAIDYNGGNYMSSYLNAVDVFQDGGTWQVPGSSDALPIKPILDE